MHKSSQQSTHAYSTPPLDYFSNLVESSSKVKINKRRGIVNQKLHRRFTLNFKISLRNSRLKLRKSSPWFKLLYPTSLPKLQQAQRCVNAPFYLFFLRYKDVIRGISQSVQSQLLKDKYSFFNATIHRKNLLREFIRTSNYKLLSKYTHVAKRLRHVGSFEQALKLNILSGVQATPTLQGPDLAIKRVRFKPGYQTIWRSARRNLQTLLLKKFEYQKKLTKFLVRHYKLSHSNFEVQALLTLQKCLLASKLVPDTAMVIFLITKNSVYLNSLSPINEKTLVFKGDFIQLKISNWLLVYNLYLNTRSNMNLITLRTLAKRKLASKILETNKSFRTRSNNMPNSFQKLIYYSVSIPTFLEVDLITSSFFVVDVHMDTLSLQNLNELLPRLNIFKNYNWKYIN